jgi:hypothetical protein
MNQALQKSGGKAMKIAAKRPIRDEKGQALLTTLLFFLIGLLVITPTLNFMGTGASTGRVYEQQVDRIYAADAGIEDALWHIRYDLIGEVLGVSYDEYDYSTPYPYPYDLYLNGKDVAVTMQNTWIPTITPAPDAATARQIIKDEKLMIIGYPSSTALTYEIKIVYYWENATERDNLRVKTVGVWLSPGFEYSEYSGSCSLQGQSFYSAPAISLYKGGQTVVWTFAAQPTLKSFPLGELGPPMVKTFTFKYTAPEGQLPELVSSWVDTTGVSGVTYTWDDSIRLYKIVSEVEGLQIEAYGAKTKFRKLKSAISSDYTVAGHRLSRATATSGSDQYARDRLYAETSSTILREDLEEVIEEGSADPGKIPEEATIEKVYLYWSGWIDDHYWYKSSSWYYWGEIADLKYGSRTNAQLIANSKVGQVKFAVDGNAQTITADKYQIKSTSDSVSGSWAYSCFTDVTDLVVSGNVTVQEYIEEAMKSAASGTVTFAMGHDDAVKDLHRPESSPPGAYANYYFALYNENDTPTGQSTGYPLATPAHKRPDQSSYDSKFQWSYAGWSLIIFYRSPGLTQRQLYLYDDFRYVGAGGSPDTETFTISGFLAPPVISEQDTSHLTYFVGEGDNHYYNDYIKVNDQALSDPGENPNPANNVFNSKSNALPTLDTDGVDVDTFTLPEGCIVPYDTSAEVKLITQRGYLNIAEIYTLVYLVLSFRSDLTTGGIITNYSVKIM